MRMDALINGGDQGRELRATLTAARRRLADTETRLERMARALAEDDGPLPITVLRQIRTLEQSAEAERMAIDKTERELSGWRAPSSPDLSAQWVSLFEGVEALDVEARMKARELTRSSFSRIVIWHAGNPAGDEDGQVIDMEITARGGGTMRLRIDRETGGLIE